MTTIRAALAAALLALALTPAAHADPGDGCIDRVPGPCVRDTYCVGEHCVYVD
jgi:hypothetical protein